MSDMCPTDLLSRRELQIAVRYAGGESFREIAAALGVAPSTVRTHLSKIYRKLDVTTKVALANVLRDPSEDGASGAISNSPVQRSPARRQIVSLAYLFLDGYAVAAMTAEMEDLRDHADGVRRLVAGIARAEGAKVLSHGGGAFALVFGVPDQNELDAECAARAALALQKEMAGLDSVPPFNDLPVGIALFTGPVVVPPRRAGAPSPPLEQIVAGAVDIAAHMARTADPGRILACPRTRAAIPIGEFAPEEEGMKTTVLSGLRADRKRFRAGTGPRTTSFVGRAMELGMLGELWASCTGGLGQAALVIGEAGIGKSRLMQEFIDLAETDADRVFFAQCDPTDRKLPFAPIRRLLLQIAEPAANETEALRGLWHGGHEAAATLDVAIGEILGDPTIGGDFAVRSSPELRRSRAFDALDTLFRQRAAHGALILAVEDVHWSDPTSLEWLARLSRGIGNAPILLLTTTRPLDGAHPITGPDIATLNLRPLTKAQADALIISQLGSDELTESRRVRIAEKAEGVPLFLEEILRTSIFLGDAVDVPETLTGALRARFDVTGEGLNIAEAASVFGRHFDVADVATILKVVPEMVEAELNDLRDANVILPVFGATAGRHQFRHSLLRDFAYGQLTRQRLVMLHKRAAEVLKRKPDAAPVVIAEHLAASGQHSEAAGRLLYAARIAVARAANREVIEICERVLAIAADLSEPTEQLGVELNARILMGVAMQALLGYSAPTVLKNYSRARELCEIAGARAELFPVLSGLYAYNLLSGNMRETYRLARQLMDLAERSDDPTQQVQAKWALGQAKLFHTADVEEGLVLLQEAAEFHDIADSPDYIRNFGQDPGVFALGISLFALVALGRFDAVRSTVRATLELADRVGHPLTRAAAVVFSSWSSYRIGDVHTAADLADQALELGQQQLLPIFEHWGQIMQAATSGNISEAAPVLQFFDHSGMNFTIVLNMPILAEKALETGDVSLASEINQRALDRLATEESEPCMSAEVYRIAARIEAARTNVAARDRWLDASWEATEATGAHYFAALCAIDALDHGCSPDPWKYRLSLAIKELSSELPTSLQERLALHLG